MLPLVANNSIPTPPSVVNTMLPGATIAHVPYDNIAPSVSSAEVSNNASNNNTLAPAPEPATTPDLSPDEALAAYIGNASPALNINAQATFLAQLIGQDITVPPETAGLMVQYEKLDAFSNVKYKPSNAQKPSGPSSAFSRILQEDSTEPVAPPVTAAKAPVIQLAMPQQAEIQAVPVPVGPVVSKVAQGAGAYAESAGRIAASSSAVVELA